MARNRLKELQDLKVAALDPDPEPVVSPEPTPPEIEDALDLKRDERQRIQQALASLGIDPGPADGWFGPDTRDALKKWQSSEGKAPTGYLDRETARTLLAVYAKLDAKEPETGATPEPTVAPQTTIPVQTVPENASVRVFTPSGTTYQDAMVVEPGQYEISVEAAHHEPFRQRLAVEGPTKYKVSLCKLESNARESCKDVPVQRTRKVQKNP